LFGNIPAGNRLPSAVRLKENIMTDKRKKALEQIAELFKKQNLAVLSTQKNSQPYASLVAFAASPDLKEVYFLTPNTTRKYEHLTASPKVSILVHDSRNQADDIYNAVSVTGTGVAREFKKEEKRTALGIYLEKHSHLKAFAAAPTTALVCIAMNRYFMVNRFQNVVEIKVES
jgi:nitroimidazol reductase NimA-like FMN-containing flavoprotein (pyridoxamine 5'-phosphate oxidase superfamily)